MRFVNADGRAALLVDGTVHDLERASGGRVSPDPMTVLTTQWDEARAVHESGAFDGGVAVADVRLGPPVPAPRSVFAIGVNYRSHAAETGANLPPIPAVFTKYPTSITGPNDPIVLPEGTSKVDWEAELTVVLADTPRRTPAERSLDHVLGFTCAQDVSERDTQFATMQFSMAKSFDTFCPLGPAVVTLDEIADPAAVPLRCRVNGEVMQDACTDDLVFDVPALVAYLSSVCTLRAGDLLLTGTPSGVGLARGRFLQPGDVVETEIDGVGELRNECVAER